MEEVKLRRNVLNKVIEIEKCLQGYRKPDRSLLAGSTGIAIFYAHLYDLTKDEEYLDCCKRVIQSILTGLSRFKLLDSFCNGFTGIAWGIQYLIEKGYIEEEEDILSPLEDYIFESALLKMSYGHYDFLHGAMGAVIFAIDRPINEKSYNFLSKCVKGISDLKIIDDFGYKWEDPTFPKDKYYRNSAAYNLGLAHGVPSIIEILRRVYEKDISKSEVQKLISGALSWVDHCKIKNGDSMFPNCMYDDLGDYDGPSKLRWCYGDLGISMTYWKCGDTFNNLNWKTAGLDIMKSCAPRTDLLKESYYDAGFCHGTAGVAHLFKKIYSITSDIDYSDISRFWIQKTLDESWHEKGLAGYKSYNAAVSGGHIYHRWRKNHGILDGVAGIGLVLICYLNGDSDWDRCLLL